MNKLITMLISIIVNFASSKAGQELAIRLLEKAIDKRDNSVDKQLVEVVKSARANQNWRYKHNNLEEKRAGKN